MINDYINNFENIAFYILFMGFKVILIALVIMLLLSLILLAIGCLIKSQKIKSKFLIVVPSLIGALTILLAIPIIFVQFKNMI